MTLIERMRIYNPEMTDEDYRDLIKEFKTKLKSLKEDKQDA